MKNASQWARLAVLPLLLVAPAAFAAEAYVQGWDVPNDPAGWVPNTITTTVAVVNAGGNPNGYLESVSNGGFNFVGATSELAEVSGDYATVTNIAFDVNYFSGTFFNVAFRARFQDPTFNGWYFPLPNDFSAGWHSYSIPLDPTLSDADAILAGWVKDDPTVPSFAATFANVYHPEVRISGNGDLNVGIDNFVLTALCTEGPSLEVTLDREILWPPNHKLAVVCATISVSDDCDQEAPEVTLVSVTSDEADNGLGDGDTEDDIQFFDPPLEGFENCLFLRSERAANGDGREYCLTYSATDSDDNTTTETVCVLVPHDQRGHANAASGFVPNGSAVQSGVSTYSIVIPSKGSFDAGSINPRHVMIGNEVGFESAIGVNFANVTGDRRVDLIAYFDANATLDLVARTAQNGTAGLSDASTEGAEEFLLDDADALNRPTASKTPTPIGLIYEGSGAVYLVDNIFRMQVLRDEDKPADDSIGDGFVFEQGVAHFAIAQPGRITVQVFNVLGQKMRTVMDQDAAAGSYSVAWDGRDDSGQPAPAGLYFTRVVAPGMDQTRRVVIAH